MINLKLIAKKLLGNTTSEMDLFLECKNGTLTKKKLFDYRGHYGIKMNTTFVSKDSWSIGYNGYTPLMFYLQSPNCEYKVVDFMLQMGADVNHLTKYGHAPNTSSAGGKLEILKLLREAGADFDIGHRAALYIYNGTAEELDYILHVSPSSKTILENNSFSLDKGPFHTIIMELSNESMRKIDDYIKKVEVLIKHRINVNINKNGTPLKLLRQRLSRKGINESSIQALKYVEKLLISSGAIEA